MQGNITDWGKEVKKGLIERGWSINDLAERIGKSRTRVSGVVNGRIYSDSIASAISDLLNIEKASASMKEATRDWCMDARKAMIDLDMNTGELADKTGYRRLKREIPEKEEFTESEKVEKRWAFLRDLMGSAHINSQESVVEKEEKRRAENMYYINRIERAIETYREECETSKKPEAMRCYREVYEYYIAEEEKTVAQIASEECVSEKTVYKDIGNACKIIAVYLLGV